MHGFMLFGRGGKVSYIEDIQKIHVTHICSVNDFLKEKKIMFFPPYLSKRHAIMF